MMVEDILSAALSLQRTRKRAILRDPNPSSAAAICLWPLTDTGGESRPIFTCRRCVASSGRTHTSSAALLHSSYSGLKPKPFGMEHNRLSSDQPSGFGLPIALHVSGWILSR